MQKKPTETPAGPLVQEVTTDDVSVLMWAGLALPRGNLWLLYWADDYAKWVGGSAFSPPWWSKGLHLHLLVGPRVCIPHSLVVRGSVFAPPWWSKGLHSPLLVGPRVCVLSSLVVRGSVFSPLWWSKGLCSLLLLVLGSVLPHPPWSKGLCSLLLVGLRVCIPFSLVVRGSALPPPCWSEGLYSCLLVGLGVCAPASLLDWKNHFKQSGASLGGFRVHSNTVGSRQGCGCRGAGRWRKAVHKRAAGRIPCEAAEARPPSLPSPALVTAVSGAPGGLPVEPRGSRKALKAGVAQGTASLSQPS